MTEIAIRQPAEVATAAVDLDGWVTVVQEVSRLASVICDTEFVPKAYRGNAAAATAAILTGRELGLPPMTALRHVQLVEGSASLSAEYKRARVLSAGHEFDVLEATTEKCTVSGRRRGSSKPPLVITFTMQDARTARIVRDRGAWTTRPRRMLFARAGTELCDFLFADVTNGLPTTELLAEDGDGASGYDEQPPQAARPNGRVTAAEITARRSVPPDVSPADNTASPPPSAGETPDPGPAVPDETPGSGPAAGPGPTSPQAASPGNPATSTNAQPATQNFTDEADYDTPGTITGPMITGIWTVLNTVYNFTHDEKPQARKVCAHITGRDLASTKNMSRNEARTVLDTLADWRETADQQGIAPRAYLVGVMGAGTEAGDE